MQTLRIALKSTGPGSVQLRYGLASSPLESRQLKTAAIQSLIDRSELYYYTSRPDLKQVGQQLFAWLDGEGRWLSRAILSADATGVVLAISTGEKLAHLPWETLHDGQGFLVDSVSTPVIPMRWLADYPAVPAEAEARPLRVLFMASSPQAVEPALDFEREESEILRSTAELPLDLRVEESGCISEMANLWRKHVDEVFDVFHLTGHASIEQGQPIFLTESETGALQTASSEDIFRAFSGRVPRLLFLSGCRTAQASDEGSVASMADTLVTLGVPAVLGWGRPILDATATQAAAVVYQRLAEGFSIAEALSATYQYLRSQEVADWHLLRLHVRIEGWEALVSSSGDYFPPFETIQDQFLDPDQKVRVARPDQFVGRRRLLQRSLRQLQHQRNCLGVLLHGMGGNGKSTLAARLLERMQGYTPIVLYQVFDADDLVSQLAKQCESEVGHDILNSELPTMQKLSRFLREGHNQVNQRFCFVLDDFEENIELDTTGRPTLKPVIVSVINDLLEAIIQSRKPHRIIITSRYDVMFPQRNQNIHREFVPALSGSDLTKKCNRLPSFQLQSSVPGSLQQQAIAVSDGNPRLLEWLDLILRDSTIDPEKILLRMTAEENRFRESILAEELLKQQTDALKEMLSLASIFEMAVPKSVMTAVWDGVIAEQREPSFKRAVSLGLIEVNQLGNTLTYRVPKILAAVLLASRPVEGWLSVHKAAAKELYALWWGADMSMITESHIRELYRLAVLAEEDEIASTVGDGLANYWNKRGHYRNAISFKEESVRFLANRENGDDAETASALSSLASLYDSQGHYGKAEKAYHQALDIWQKFLPEDDPDIVTCFGNLAILYQNQGRYDESEALSEKVLAFYRAQADCDYSGLALNINNMAALYQRQGRYKESEALYLESSKIYRDILEDEDLMLATGLNNLSMLYTSTGQYSQALPLAQEAMTLYRELFGDTHPNVATSLNNVAALLYHQGDYATAEQFYGEAARIWETLLGEEHPHVARSFNNIGQLYYAQGKYAEAEALYKRAIALYKQLPAKTHPDLPMALINLATVYLDTYQYDDAEVLYLEALETTKQFVDDDHLDIVTNLSNLGMLYIKQRRYKEAETVLLDASKMIDRAVQTEHPTKAAILNNLGLLYEEEEKYLDAEVMYETAFDINKRVLGDSHPSTVKIWSNLARLYLSTDRYDEAEVALKASLEMSMQVLGESHPDVAAALNNLAGLYNRQKRYNEARSFYQRSLDLNRRLWGDVHPAIATTLSNLADVYESTGEYERAESLWNDALSMSAQLNGREHLDVAEIIVNLAIFYRHRGRYAEAESLHKEALATRQKLLGREHPDVARSYISLALVYEDKENYDEAERCRLEEIDIQKQLLGEDHEEIASSALLLGWLYFKQKRYKDAETAFMEAIAIFDRLALRDTKDAVRVLESLSLLYSEEGRYDEARALSIELIAAQKKLLGDQHPKTIGQMHRLALMYYRLGRYDEAEVQAHKALALRRQVLSDKHKDIVFSLKLLSWIHDRQDRFIEAASFYEQAIALSVEVFGPDHPSTQAAQDDLCQMLQRQNEPS